MSLTRRHLIQCALTTAAMGAFSPVITLAQQPALLTKPIPTTSETIPVIGLGSWITFNVGDDKVLLDECAAVIEAFFKAGGRLIDSSPMYGSSQPTIGHALKKLGMPKPLFSAEKVWISDPSGGPAQMERSRELWGVPRFDLMQVHNLRSWEAHLETLKEMKADGRLRYIGITTSHGRRHRALEKVMESKPVDFVQLTYNAIDRAVENRLLPLARERGIAVIANRPFRRGALIKHAKRHPLPAWAADAGAENWAEFLLKYIVSHDAVTCAIPATSQVDHLSENMGAVTGALPDAAMRERMAAHIRDL